METLERSKEHTVTPKQFTQLFNDIIDKDMWELRSQDDYFTAYESLSNKYPSINKDELQSFIMKKTAKEYADANGFDDMKKDAFTLFAAAPHYAIYQARKDQQGANEKNLAVVGNFNDQVRNFVARYSEVDKDMLSERLVESIDASGIGNDFANQAQLRQRMDDLIRGVHGEVGMEQLFDYADIDYTRGDHADDLAHIDYKVKCPKKVLKFDVKSSSNATGTDTAPYSRISEDHYRLLRLFSDGDFKNNSFQMREESLRTKAPAVRALIDEIAKIG